MQIRKIYTSIYLEIKIVSGKLYPTCVTKANCVFIEVSSNNSNSIFLLLTSEIPNSARKSTRFFFGGGEGGKQCDLQGIPQKRLPFKFKLAR